MESCDVLVIGGGPAGSTCAGRLRQAGLDVLLLDKATFPRDKPCAGWITPLVLGIDRDDYRQGRLLQEISSFRTGLVQTAGIWTGYNKPVSYGIRRCEFDHYLLQRSAVRRSLGETAVTLQRHQGGWLVNGRIHARLLIGAGGHFCPLARLMGAKLNKEEAVVAMVAEFALPPEQERLCPVQGGTPALYFCRDLLGYGWLLRKGGYLNIGLGRLDRQGIGQHLRDFQTFLEQQGELPPGTAARFQGHAYLLYGSSSQRCRSADSALLIGDAAGMAHRQSGEGILPAIESAILAADTVIAAKGDYQRANLESYEARLAARFSYGKKECGSSPRVSGLARFFGARLFGSRWFARHILLDRWFLHADRQQLAALRPLQAGSTLSVATSRDGQHI